MQAAPQLASGGTLSSHPNSTRYAAFRRRVAGIDAAGRQRALIAVKGAHTLVWFSIEACMGYLLWTGFAKRSDRSALAAGAVVGVEGLIFLGNGGRCPLTGLAESLGAERGSVTDIFLPRWFAANLPAIHAPLVVLAAYLHARTLVAGDATAPCGVDVS